MTKRHKDPTLFEEIRVVLVCASLENSACRCLTQEQPLSASQSQMFV